jgi:hypothetical protein
VIGGDTVQNRKRNGSSNRPLQYNVLREGGTERPGWSIETEKRLNVRKVACGTPPLTTTKLAVAPDAALRTCYSVVEKVDPITANIAGAESRAVTAVALISSRRVSKERRRQERETLH